MIKSMRRCLACSNPTPKVHPDLLNSRFGYVAISRASHEATLLTNDAAKLAPQLKAAASKPPLWKSVKHHLWGSELG
jgi:hypothetical protein